VFSYSLAKRWPSHRRLVGLSVVCLRYTLGYGARQGASCLRTMLPRWGLPQALAWTIHESILGSPVSDPSALRFSFAFFISKFCWSKPGT